MGQSPDAEERLLATDLHVEATSRLMEALVESENRMRRRLELLADAVIETDAEQCLVFVNAAWQSLTGLSPDASLGRDASSLFPEDCRADIHRVLADHRVAHRELVTRIDHVDGRAVHVAVTTSPIPHGGVVAVVRDITRETEYQAELVKLSAVASATSNLVIITDATGRIEWVNPAFELRTGYSLSEVGGLSPGSFLQGPNTDAATVERLRAAIRDRRSTREELLNYTRAGEPYWVAINLTPILTEDGRLERFISVQADVTERKRIDQMKSEFVSTVSHELRTPLTAISGALGLVSAGVAGPLPEQATRLLDIAQKNSERLTMLINDLLDMDRLVSNGLPIESEDHHLLSIVRLAIHQNQTYAEQHGVSLTLVEPAVDAIVDVDSLRLMQVLSNLLSNASKFAPGGTSVDVSTLLVADRVRVCVRDRGAGIPEAFHDAVFEKFTQADASDTRPVGGSGLGLAISKELVERMGGCIGFTSIVGEGTTFFVDLPYSGSATEAE